MKAATKRRVPRTTADDSAVVPPGYKRTEVGVIPEAWQTSDIGSSRPFITSGSRGWAKYYAVSGSPFIRIGNLTREQIYLDLSDLKFVQLLDSGDAEAERTCVQEGDLLVSITADIGIVGYVDASVDKPAYINQHLALIRLDSTRISTKFVAYYLASERPQRLFVASMDLGAKAGLNLSTIRKLRLALPSPPEQRAIAEALSDVDGLLGALEALIAKKRAIKQAAMQQLLTGKTRLPSFRGPWETKRLGEIGATYGGLTGKGKADFESGEGRYVTFLNILNNVVLDPDGLEYVNIEPTESQNRVRMGDLLLNGTSETPGDLAMGAVVGISEPDLFLNSFCFGFRIQDQDKYSPLFLAYYFRGSPGRQLMYALAQGATRYNMSKGQFMALTLPLPQPDEQTAIATVLSDMDDEIAALERRRDKSRAIKQGMMQQLLTGRVRLVTPEAAS